MIDRGIPPDPWYGDYLATHVERDARNFGKRRCHLALAPELYYWREIGGVLETALPAAPGRGTKPA